MAKECFEQWLWELAAAEIHLTNWNQIDIPIDVFESNVPIVRNLMCTEADKEEYGFPLGGKVNFAG